MEGSDSNFYIGSYMGFVDGISDSLQIFGFVCYPAAGVTGGQLYDIVGLHIEKNPQIRNKPAAKLAQQALLIAFPCEEK